MCYVCVCGGGRTVGIYEGYMCICTYVCGICIHQCYVCGGNVPVHEYVCLCVCLHMGQGM